MIQSNSIDPKPRPINHQGYAGAEKPLTLKQRRFITQASQIYELIENETDAFDQQLKNLPLHFNTPLTHYAKCTPYQERNLLATKPNYDLPPLLYAIVHKNPQAFLAMCTYDQGKVYTLRSLFNFLQATNKDPLLYLCGLFFGDLGPDGQAVLNFVLEKSPVADLFFMTSNGETVLDLLNDKLFLRYIDQIPDNHCFSYAFYLNGLINARKHNNPDILSAFSRKFKTDKLFRTSFFEANADSSVLSKVEDLRFLSNTLKKLDKEISFTLGNFIFKNLFQAVLDEITQLEKPDFLSKKPLFFKTKKSVDTKRISLALEAFIDLIPDSTSQEFNDCLAKYPCLRIEPILSLIIQHAYWHKDQQVFLNQQSNFTAP